MTTKAERFTKHIDALCEDSGINYIDAIIEYCDINGIEPEAIGKFIRKNPKILSKIQAEAEDLNFLQKTARLPL